jgi:hypothetical protein
MTKKEALDILNKLKRLCRGHGIWYSVQKENKPELKNILINISIKVD